MTSVTVNGERRELSDGTTVAELLAGAGGPGARGCAVALNGEVVPRGSWPDTAVLDGARVEIVIAVQGG